MNAAGPGSKTSAGAAEDEWREDSLFEDSSFFANITAAEAVCPRTSAEQSANASALNVSALCCDEEISGFDRLSGRTWIYPTNYPVRDYQFNIIKATIVQNTLVSLPTGLGKTFIAAVIMYNFYRWYPLGKIVFTAPTRPLVAQQIHACYSIVAIPRADTVEMTGHMQAATRKMHWKEKRVFFATPQVIYNDLKSGICPADRIRCLVFDEAHRARGNYAYCQIMATLSEMGHATCRVLALSATPGSKVDDVISVVKNLRIAHLELRTENCVDVARYSHAKQINTVVIPLGEELSHVRRLYIEILDTYTRRLKQLNILVGNIGNLSKGRIVMLYKEFQSKDRGARHPQHNHIMRDFTVLISLYHGLELLARHGSRVFLNFFDEHTEKGWMQADDRLTVLLERLRDDLGVNPLALDRSTLPDGTVAAIPKDITFGHPKFDRLREIVMKHFNEAKENGKETKAIVFCEYRESVHLVHCLLLQCRPLVQPQMFVGQGAAGREGAAAVSQKAQLRVMRTFRDGACNVLVATCVAEEGLDVGSVDLIVCFDTSTRSPIRLVQRCGRTGRERGGKVYILVTEGREHQTLLECMRQRDNLTGRIHRSPDVRSALYTRNPRMLPHGFTPECRKMHITMDSAVVAHEKRKVSNQKDLRHMLAERAPARASTSAEPDGLITRQQFTELFPAGLPRPDYFEEPKEMWNCRVDEIKHESRSPRASLELSEWLEWQRTLQTAVRVGHSSDARVLSELLQYADTRRFQLPPSTQDPDFNTQILNANTQALLTLPPNKSKMKTSTKVETKKKKRIKHVAEPANKYGDIRALFSTTKKSTKEYTKVVKDLGIESNSDLPTSLIDLMVDLCVQDENKSVDCKACKIINCDLLCNIKKQSIVEPPTSIISIFKNLQLPDIKLLDTIDIESIERAGKLSRHKKEFIQFSEEIFSDNVIVASPPVIITEDISPNRSAINKLQKSVNKTRTSNFDLDFDFNGSDIEEGKSCDNSNANNFNIGGLDDIFADSISAISDDEGNDNNKTKEGSDNNNDNPKKALKFFGLDSIDDIFADYDDVEVIENSPTETRKSMNNIKSQTFTEDPFPKPIQDVRPTSPSLLSGTQVVNNTIVSPILCSQLKERTFHKTVPTSPILCSQKKIHTNNSVKPYTLMEDEIINNSTTKFRKKNNDTAGSKSMFSITQLIDIINKSDRKQNATNCLQDISIACTSKTSSQNKSITHPASLHKAKSMSPTIFTQVDRRKSLNASNSFSKSDRMHQTPKNNTISPSSPILLTQMDRSRLKTCRNKSISSDKINESIVILDSDSDETVNYSVTPEVLNCQVTKATSPNDVLRVKRKLDITEDSFVCSSPFFTKRPKFNENNNKNKPLLSLKDKIRSIFPDRNDKTNNPQIHTVIAQDPIFQNENKSPNKLNNEPKNEGVDQKKSIFSNDFDASNKTATLPKKTVLEKLHQFRRNSQRAIERNKVRNKESRSRLDYTSCTDSDDDFVIKNKNLIKNRHKQTSPVINYKVRKKKRRRDCEFLELSAELSGSSRDSGDELTDESSGSIAGFICDETHRDTVDMQAHYLRSVKSPVNGMFKIPAMPRPLANVLSQPLDNDDDYEMDSFCVEGDVGLTQVRDISELELAERKLKRRKKKNSLKSPQQGNGNETSDSPVARPRRAVRRRLSSESGSNSE